MEIIDQNGCIGFTARQVQTADEQTTAGGQSQSVTETPGAWRIETSEDGTMRMVDCFYTVGNVTYQHSDVDLSELVGSGSGFVAFDYSTGERRDVELYSSLSELSEAQRVYENMIVPLYRFVGGRVATDLRCAPKIQAFEVLQ